MITPTLGICSACNEERKWYEAVDTTLREEFPEVDPTLSVRGDSPWFRRWQALWTAREQPVIDFSYDDKQQAFCAMHLRQLADTCAQVKTVPQ